MTGTSLGEIVRLIRERDSVWLRAAAVRQNDVWLLRAVEIIVNWRPSQWAEVDWRYANARFLAAQLASWGVADSLESGNFVLREIECDGFSVPGEAQFDRRASFAGYGASEPFEWPSDEYRISISGTINSVPGEMVAAGMPVFESFDVAFANTFGLTRLVNWQTPAREVVVRDVDLRGRIVGAVVASRSVDATVDGDALEGMTLSLASNHPSDDRGLSGVSPQSVHFGTPDGTPLNAWLALTAGDELVDRRMIDRNRIREPEPGVQYVSPPRTFDENEPYSADEQRQIIRAIEHVKRVLPARCPELTDEQLLAFEQELDDAVGQLPSLPRKLWDALFSGTVWRALLRGVITEAAALLVIHALGVETHALPHEIDQLRQLIRGPLRDR